MASTGATLNKDQEHMLIPIKDNVPSLHRPYINWGIITVNVIVFLSLLGPGFNQLTISYGLAPARFLTLSLPGMIGNIITASFIHGSWLHLLGNMLFLWIFGDNVEDLMGHVRYLFFYLLTGTIALLSYVFLNVYSQVPLIGASGAVSGVLGAYLVLFPKAKVLTVLFVLFFLVPLNIPAVIFLGFWFVLQVINESMVLGLKGSGGVAFAAHIGGFLAGALLVRFFISNRATIS